jgi:histidine ammonia-lyase
VSALLDASLTGLPPFLARRPGPESGALVLEYTAHAAVATELVVAVRALRLAGHEPVGAGTRGLWRRAAPRLDPSLEDRPLHPDIEAARSLIAGWGSTEPAEPDWGSTEPAER